MTVAQCATEYQNRVYINQNYETLIPSAYWYFNGKADAYEAGYTYASTSPTLTDLNTTMVISAGTSLNQRNTYAAGTDAYNFFNGRYDAFNEAAALAV